MNMMFGAIRSAVTRSRPDERYRVLIAEDNDDLARVMALLLGHSGFEVKLTDDGRLALAIARTFHPHFVLLDIGLPGMDGCQVAEQLREDAEFDKSVIIAVSAYGPEMIAGRCLKPPFNHHLTKPVSLEDLLALMIPCGGDQSVA